MTARDVARRVLDRVDRGGAWATPALDGELARSGLDERDRRLAAELVYGVLRHRARIDRALAAHADLARTPPRVVTALRVAAYQLLFLDRVPSYAAVDDAVRAARGVAGTWLSGFANAVLRKVSREREPALPDEPRARIEIEHSLPAWIVDELAAAAPDRLAELAAAFAAPAPLVARGNRLQTTREDLIAELAAAGIAARPVAAAPMALTLDGVGDPSRAESFRAGRWTVQDTGAQLVGLIAAPRPGQRILDACAGVGGKSTHLAELSSDAAQIDAADQLPTKLDLAIETAHRLGLASIRPVPCDLLDPAAPLAAAYDLIVLDAPCSGLGVLRRHPDAKWRQKPADVPRLAQLQRQLLDAVVARLAPEGALVYSVCTFTGAEGPDQVAALVARTGLRLVDERRTWPPDADAFYIARLER
ncbi:MAG: 16S rRNA (cytosine(967)-C(5))-methyltransferase RsmB [Deltaproteobacteria bacterium]|nr:MAG: 16S rRNA (cytosine(967)-C(5))-methyltransferase RsmB [Deltaproteobacteria bacterium]TMQ08820.1 MAG: 16S rRNA (cytosine(967)-C(5))-methyltransferase RsmB [Deltaproteobacteria bacterium]